MGEYGSISYTPDVPASFLAAVVEGLSQLPPLVFQYLTEHGVYVWACRRISEQWAGEWSNEVPRGWDGDMTWENCSAFYSVKKRCVVLAMEYAEPGDGRTWVREDRIGWVVLHELGHAYDHLARVAFHEPFRSTYLNCRREVMASPELRDVLRYNVWHWAAGLTETFADAFAYSCLTQKKQVPDRHAFQQAFGPIIDIVGSMLATGTGKAS